MTDIILTADRTLMNNFHIKGDFTSVWYGSADSFPFWLFKIMAGEPKKNDSHEIIFSPYPLRKIEAKIIQGGFDVVTVSPKDLSKYIKKAKILGIHTINPLGLGTSPIFRQLNINGVEYSTKYFKRLLKNKIIENAKRKGLKIIVGGEGAWQLQKNPEIQQELGIDCVVVGEAENLINDIIRKVYRGESIPSSVECNKENIPTLDEISCITKASNYGCIEIGRGCVRGCKFCNVSKNKLRWIPYENIKKELKINADAGITQGLLHAEDILLYGQYGVIPDKDKVIKLMRLAKNYYKKVHITHLSLAAVSAQPSIIPQCMEIVLQNQKFMLGETGIETGSPNLLSKTMSGKVRPFRIDQWIEIIHKSLGILHDNSFIPYCSIILGLPGEKEEDIVKTLELLDDCKHYRCSLLPLNFTPLGSFTKKQSFSAKLKSINEAHKEIIAVCNRHNVYWADTTRDILFENSKYKNLLNLLADIRMKHFIRKAKKYDLF